MSKIVELIYEIIGSEKWITLLIVGYAFADTINDSKLANIDITNLVNNKKNGTMKYIDWINNDYFYSISRNNILCIYLAKVEPMIVYDNISLDELDIESVIHILVLDNIIVIVGYRRGSYNIIVHDYNFKRSNWVVETGIIYGIAKNNNAIDNDVIIAVGLDQLRSNCIYEIKYKKKFCRKIKCTHDCDNVIITTNNIIYNNDSALHDVSNIYGKMSFTHKRDFNKIIVEKEFLYDANSDVVRCYNMRYDMNNECIVSKCGSTVCRGPIKYKIYTIYDDSIKLIDFCNFAYNATLTNQNIRTAKIENKNTSYIKKGQDFSLDIGASHILNAFYEKNIINVKIYDIYTKKMVKQFTLNDNVYAIIDSLNGRHLIILYDDGKIYLLV